MSHHTVVEVSYMYWRWILYRHFWWTNAFIKAPIEISTTRLLVWHVLMKCSCMYWIFFVVARQHIPTQVLYMCFCRCVCSTSCLQQPCMIAQCLSNCYAIIFLCFYGDYRDNWDISLCGTQRYGVINYPALLWKTRSLHWTWLRCRECSLCSLVFEQSVFPRKGNVTIICYVSLEITETTEILG